MSPISRSPQNNQTGFTLVELVVVIIVLGVISVVAAPRFIGSQGFDEIALRDEVMQRLRAVQLSAMNGVAADCHALVINSDEFGVSVMDADPCPGTLEHVTDYSQTGLSISQGIFGFDRLGRPTDSCNGGCNIEIIGTTTETITIESEGFIHGL
ncbi:prepilin-type N-terminal cleavage/methylation domain-containing protein [Neiella sp. HB171785]|uniref:Prepilin-type N-terminal cleavage/methylation domain-containing protein n=1 Tax=Neiella litorisoli TaxID=2771431 RepID=A0A8J6UM40_9GAMM|nr:prepilin-type N-terminal cleavage/methylation domain-containing protein [Neiella litorisoli]MBD1389865.1 prepilin-type N-terminal cleavage/methylation domain-containing protein [Neiella litorisoli]